MPLVKPDGLYHLGREDYDAIKRTNFSWLKLFAKSPAHAQHALLEPRPDTDALRLGRVTHLAVLEPEQFRSTVAVWDGGRRCGKDWEKFVAQNSGRELLTEEEHRLCIDMQNAVRTDRHALRYISNGKPEVTVLWTADVHGLPIQCKCRLDFDTDEAIVEVKTTKDASPSGFGRQSFGLRYHVQGAWQVDGYVRAAAIKKPHVTVSVEKEPPHVVQVYRTPERYLELGRAEYRFWLERLAACRETSRWPAYADGELELEFPPWAIRDDEDLGALGLTSGGVAIGTAEEG